jgi:hypothetical protein
LPVLKVKKGCPAGVTTKQKPPAGRLKLWGAQWENAPLSKIRRLDKDNIIPNNGGIQWNQ